MNTRQFEGFRIDDADDAALVLALNLQHNSLALVPAHPERYDGVVDSRRWTLNPDAPRSGWRYWLDVGLAAYPLVVIPLAMAVVGVVLLVRWLI